MIQVHAITFAPDHASIQFMDLPGDVRDEGRVAVARQIELFVSHPDYREAIRKLHDRAVALIEDGLENWQNTTPYNPEDDDEDDERGMGE